ncbi:MAG: hypothetical protein ACR2RB_02025 [Gammaproteobacteria bacterium]
MEDKISTPGDERRASLSREFQQILRAFRSGDRSLAKALTEIDQLVKDDPAAPIDVLAALIKEDANQPLPTEAFEAFERRLMAHDGNGERIERSDTVEEEAVESTVALVAPARPVRANTPWYARSAFATLAGLLMIGLAWAAYHAFGDGGLRAPALVTEAQEGAAGEPPVSADTSLMQGQQAAASHEILQPAGVGTEDWQETQRQLQLVQEEQQTLADALTSQRDEAAALRRELEQARAQLAQREAELESAQEQTASAGDGVAESALANSQARQPQGIVESQEQAPEASAQGNAAEREALLTELDALRAKDQQLQQTLEARRVELETAQAALAETQAALTERLKSVDRSASEIEQLESRVTQLQTAVDDQKQQTELLEREQEDERAVLLSRLDELQIQEQQLQQSLHSRDERLSALQTELADLRQQGSRMGLETDMQLPAAHAVAASATAPEPLQPGEVDQASRQIADMLALADDQFESLQLTRPAGRNAYETYQQVLTLEPGNPEALNGIGEVRDRYVGWAEIATSRKNWPRARRYLEAALTIAPDDFTLQAALQDVIQTQKSLRRVEELLAQAQDHLSAGRLIGPAGRNAWESFTEVLSLDAGNSEAQRGRELVMARIEMAVREQQQKGNLRESLSVVEGGLDVFPDHVGLQELKKNIQRQLAEAALTSVPVLPPAGPPPAEQRAAEQPPQADEEQDQIKVFGTF